VVISEALASEQRNCQLHGQTKAHLQHRSGPRIMKRPASYGPLSGFSLNRWWRRLRHLSSNCQWWTRIPGIFSSCATRVPASDTFLRSGMEPPHKELAQSLGQCFRIAAARHVPRNKARAKKERGPKLEASRSYPRHCSAGGRSEKYGRQAGGSRVSGQALQLASTNARSDPLSAGRTAEKRISNWALFLVFA
jgi:hypothetical protein